MRYYRLPPEEWHRLDAICAPHGVTPPPAAVATAMVAEDDSGDLVMAVFLLLTLHYENMVAVPHPGIRESLEALQLELDRGLLEQLPPGDSVTYYTNVATAPRMLEFAARMGMTPLEGFVPHIKTITKPADS